MLSWTSLVSLRRRTNRVMLWGSKGEGGEHKFADLHDVYCCCLRDRLRRHRHEQALFGVKSLTPGAPW